MQVARSSSLRGQAEEAPVGDRPDARSQALDLAAARDDEPESARCGGGAWPLRPEKVDEGAGVRRVGALGRLGLQGQEARAGVKHEVDLPSRARPVEVQRRRVGLPGAPAHEFRQDGGLEERTLGLVAVRVHGHAELAGDFGVGKKLGRAHGAEVLGERELVEVGDPSQVREVALEVGPAEVAQRDLPVVLGQWLERRVAAPAAVVLGAGPAAAHLVRRDWEAFELREGGLALLPEEVEAWRRDARSLAALDERERPELEQRRPSRRRLADLLERQDLAGAEEQEPVPLLPVRQELHGVEQVGLLLDFVEDDQPLAVVEPADGVGGRYRACGLCSG